MFRLSGRVALITGASSGLGRHFAGELASAGAKVVLAARRRELLEHTASHITGDGGTAFVAECDVTEPDSVSELFSFIDRDVGGLDILVNNAGVAGESWLLETDESEWHRILGVNLDGARRVAVAAARAMKAAGRGGSIINVASVLGSSVLKKVGPYAVSKAALVHLTKAMALELARDRIRVNALAPGYVETEINREFLQSERGRALLSRIAFRRAGERDELTGPLLLLASDAGSYMTGSVIAVDGGAALGLV